MSKKAGTTNTMRVSHSFIYLGDGMVAESTWGYGAIIRSVKHYAASMYNVYVGKYSFTDEEKDTIVQNAIALTNGTSYSLIQIFILLLRGTILNCIPFKDYDKAGMTCSEYVAAVFKNSGKDLFPGKDAADVLPAEILNSGIFTIIEVDKAYI